jgi:hypothetical protein
MIADTEIIPAAIRLSNYRTLKISMDDDPTSTRAPGIRISLETYVTNTGQTKVFAFSIPFEKLTSAIDALAAAEQMAIDAGIIARIEDGEVQS